MPKILRNKCPKTKDGKHARYEELMRVNGKYGSIVYCAACKITLRRWKPL